MARGRPGTQASNLPRLHKRAEEGGALCGATRKHGALCYQNWEDVDCIACLRKRPAAMPTLDREDFVMPLTANQYSVVRRFAVLDDTLRLTGAGVLGEPVSIVHADRRRSVVVDPDGRLYRHPRPSERTEAAMRWLGVGGDGA